MSKNTDTSLPVLLACEAGYDPIEDRLRQNVRVTIEALFEEELAEVIGRCRYGHGGITKKGYRHGHPLPGKRMNIRRKGRAPSHGHLRHGDGERAARPY